MLRKLLEAWANHLPVKVINDTSSGVERPYLRRYYVASLGGFRLYLHHFVASDPDRGLHNHPWDWSIGLPLVGGYTEAYLDRFSAPYLDVNARAVRPFQLNFIGRRKFHRVIIEPGTTSWSLFLHSPHKTGWGFIRETPGLVAPDGTQVKDRGVTVSYWEKFSSSVLPWWPNAKKGRDIGPWVQPVALAAKEIEHPLFGRWSLPEHAFRYNGVWVAADGVLTEAGSIAGWRIVA